VAEITLFSSHYAEMQWLVSALNSANNVNHTDAVDWKKLHTLANGNLLTRQEQYTRKLVRESNAFDNVIFEIQNEPWSDRPKLVDVINPYLPLPARNTYPNAVEIADELSLAWQARVKDWIRSDEAALPNKHLIAQNYCNFRFTVQGIPADVGLVNVHYAYPEAVSLNYGVGKALGYDETGFLCTAVRHGTSCYLAAACSTAWITRFPWGTKMERIPHRTVLAAQTGATAPITNAGGIPSKFAAGRDVS
jgi:hypothetical protein